MRFIIELYFGIPYPIRVMLLLFICIVLGWRILRGILIRILSLIPFISEKIFKILFILLEYPVSLLHGRFGKKFGKIDDSYSLVGDKIDKKILNWYKAWRNPKEFKWVGVLICYFVCIAYILTPLIFKTDSSLLNMGEKAYLTFEDHLRQWEYERYGEEETAILNDDVDEEKESEIATGDTKVLIAYRLTTSLLVRDIPDVDHGEILTRIYNGNQVHWNGEMVFSQVGEIVEPWVKISTSDGIEGWCRLAYLYPEGYADKIYIVSN